MSDVVLVVDDDPDVLASVSELLEADGYETLTASDAESALRIVGEEPPGLVLSDIRMPGLDGLELLDLLEERAPSVDVVLMTAYDDMPTVVRAMRDGAFEFLTKPLDLHELRSLVADVFRDRAQRDAEVPASDERAPIGPAAGMVGNSPAMIEVYKKVGRVARSRANVLVRGETGTGKELVARNIHRSSPWSEEPFVAVNCTAVPSGLLESELFGHVRGAFTGAVSDRRGRFALAGRGTVFLDEIGDTGLDFQARLLRVLEDGEYFPVGAESSETSEARVIAATHRDLERLIEEGSFRKDLFYRLRVVEVWLPPLRERPDDIPLLADHLLQKTAHELHLSPPALSDEALERLLDHDWPGNVREMENCLARALTLAGGEVIRPEHLDLTPGERPSTSGIATLEESERAHLVRALEAADGNKTRAAELLEVSRPRLYRLLEKHGLR